MTRPTPSDLLEAWERGLRLPPSDRCLPLLAAGGPDGSEDEVAQLPVGERDARLLDLREWAFGPAMTGTATCPACGSEVELPVDVAQIRVAEAAPAADDAEVETDAWRVHFRLPDSDDLRAASRAGDVGAARAVLLRRCVLAVTRDGVDADPVALPDAVVERLEVAMAARAAQADVQVALSCPDCRHAWQAEFDVGVFVWGEIDQWARRLLVDVATLAAAFGWSEDEVLRLGGARRSAYLQLAGQ